MKDLCFLFCCVEEDLRQQIKEEMQKRLDEEINQRRSELQRL